MSITETGPIPHILVQVRLCPYALTHDYETVPRGVSLHAVPNTSSRIGPRECGTVPARISKAIPSSIFHRTTIRERGSHKASCHIVKDRFSCAPQRVD